MGKKLFLRVLIIIFKTFGKSRKTYISFEDIFKHIQELQESLSEHKTGECLLQDHKFWTDLCTVLGVPNTSSNRYQLKRAYKDENVKKVQTEEDGREDEAEIEGAEVEKVTQHRSDFHQEDEKEHSNKKDIIQDEDVLKSEGGKKESKKQKEFKQVDINKDDSKEVKAALKEVDEEENAPEIEVVKEEEFTQEMTTFQKEDDKEHTREEDLIQEEEDLTDDIAQAYDKYHKVEDSDSWSDTEDDVSLDKEDEFFTESVPAPSFFFIPRTAWRKLRKTKKGSL
ncbi:high mobility group nucleosome-binding domain-containing protein 5-like [Labeo rohita]|uniref:high mobility group nucleosome-binding domain-containing protein 5-like n=1 Tax=Labeo rohita TaxID=84645 RepID=UPI0021E348E3|nr:high mobility group nucleosome-binding domain-containing protein 5-like [Labeo rohita]